MFRLSCNRGKRNLCQYGRTNTMNEKAAKNTLLSLRMILAYNALERPLLHKIRAYKISEDTLEVVRQSCNMLRMCYRKLHVRIVCSTTSSAATIASCMRSRKSCPFSRRFGSGPTRTPQPAIARKNAVRTSVFVFSLAIPIAIARCIFSREMPLAPWSTRGTATCVRSALIARNPGEARLVYSHAHYQSTLPASPSLLWQQTHAPVLAR